MTEHSRKDHAEQGPADVADFPLAQPPADPHRNLKDLFAQRGLAVVRVTTDVD